VLRSVDKLAPWYGTIFTSERDKLKERREHILMPSKTTKKEIRATQEIMQIVQRYAHTDKRTCACLRRRITRTDLHGGADTTRS
jgi:hypothetical protein